MADDLLELTQTGTLGQRVGGMSPLELLAQTLDRAALTDVQEGGGAITAGDVERWSQEIAGADDRWGMAEQIRADILAYRVGEDSFVRAFGPAANFGAATQAATGFQGGGEWTGGAPGLGELIRTPYTNVAEGDPSARGRGLQAAGGDIAARYAEVGLPHPTAFGWTGQGGVPGWEDDDSAADLARQRELALINLKNGFIGELVRIGLEPEVINELWDWVHGQFTADPTFTAAQAMLEIYDQQAFKDRFPAIAQMRDQKGRRDIPSPAEYLERERTWATHLEKYGMSDLGADLNQLVEKSYIAAVGDGEFIERLEAASKMIFEAPAAVKDTFGDWYGPRGDAALMATFLDPTDEVFGGEWKTWVGIKGAVAAAEVGGWSKMLLDLDSPVSKTRSTAIAKLGMDQAAVWEGFSRLKQRENLFIEKISEEEDLIMEKHGVAGAFGIDYRDDEGILLDSGQEVSRDIERRAQTRTAEFRGGGGAMLAGTTTGFGAVNA